MLFAVFFSLIFLTILTVVTSGLEMPHAFHFPIAMIIASMKAFLVCAFFMHMWWDKGFNIMLFFTPLLFASLFIGMTLMDTDHYQDTIDAYDIRQMPKVANSESATEPVAE